MDKENRTRRDLGYDVHRANSIVVYAIERLRGQERARRKGRRKMATLGNLALQDGNDIGVGTIRHYCANGRLACRRQDERGPSHRDSPATNGARAPQIWIGKWAGLQEIDRAQYVALFKIAQ